MKLTGIGILDQALQQIAWMKLPSYRRFRLRYGERKARILRDYIIFPLFGIEKVSRLKGKVPYRIQEVYEVLRLLFRFPQLVRDVARSVLRQQVAVYYSLSAEERSRVKFTLIADDTYDPKTGQYQEGAAELTDHHDGQVKKLYNPVVIYCRIDGLGEQLCFPLDLDVWQQQKRQRRSRQGQTPGPIAHRKRWEIGKDMLADILNFCRSINFPFAQCDVAADAAYCVEEFYDIVRAEPGLKFVTRPRRTHSFKIDGQQDSLHWHARDLKPHRWKRSAAFPWRYIKKKAFHKKYGECTILFYEVVTKTKSFVRFLVASTQNIRADALFKAFARRWSIEVFFRNIKQVLAFRDYSGRKFRAVKAHYLLRLLTAIVMALLIRCFVKEPSCRAFLPRKITFGDMRSFIIEHYRFSQIC